MLEEGAQYSPIEVGTPARGPDERTCRSPRDLCVADRVEPRGRGEHRARPAQARQETAPIDHCVHGTLKSPSAGGVTRRSVGFVSCGIHPYGMRYERYTAFDGFGPAPANSGNMYSQTIAPSLVTSKSRPPAPAVMRVLPFGSRCALLMLV